MSVLPFVVEAVVIGPPCIALGFVGGVKYQHRKLTREVAMQAQGVKTWFRKRPMLALAAFLILMASLTYSSSRESGHALDSVQHQSDCLTTYANQLYDSLTPRQAASEALQTADERFNDALVQLLRDTLSAHPVQATSRADAVALAKAAQHKQMVADQLSRERAANPYPPPPKKVCPT